MSSESSSGRTASLVVTVLVAVVIIAGVLVPLTGSATARTFENTNDHDLRFSPVEGVLEIKGSADGVTVNGEPLALPSGEQIVALTDTTFVSFGSAGTTKLGYQQQNGVTFISVSGTVTMGNGELYDEYNRISYTRAYILDPEGEYTLCDHPYVKGNVTASILTPSKTIPKTQVYGPVDDLEPWRPGIWTIAVDSTDEGDGVSHVTSAQAVSSDDRTYTVSFLVPMELNIPKDTALRLLTVVPVLCVMAVLALVARQVIPKRTED